MKALLLIIPLITAILLSACQSTDNGVADVTSLQFTYLDTSNITINQQKIANGEAAYVTARKHVMAQARKALDRKIDPVTNKPKAGPSGDLHDYLSIGPYWWPDKSKPDGLPWIRRDGEVNPKTRGTHTDKLRSGNFLRDLGYLNIAYLYSGPNSNDSKQYLEKMKALMNTWLIDPKTKMNPNLNYAQGVPGASTGRPFGVIEFEKVANIVTSVQLLKQTNTVDEAFVANANTWLSDYLNWLLTSEIGMAEGATKNNHGNWYDYQVIGLMLHLGKTADAQRYATAIKTKRINPQIKPDGSQPLELARTKSVNYSSMNLMALLHNAELARKVNIDLLNYTGTEKQSIKTAVEYLIPYVQGKKQWQYKQLGGVQKAFNKKTYNSLFVAQKLYGSQVVPNQLIEQNMQYISPVLLLVY